MPELSEFLIDACVANECVLFAGAGLSARAGFLTWVPFVRSLLNWCFEGGFIDESSAESHRAAIEKGDVGSVADGIVDALHGRENLLHEFLSETFATLTQLSDAHSILRKIKFSAALTTNFDDLIEKTFPDQNLNIYTPTDTQSLLEALHKRDFFILKLYGSLQRPETLMI